MRAISPSLSELLATSPRTWLVGAALAAWALVATAATGCRADEPKTPASKAPAAKAPDAEASDADAAEDPYEKPVVEQPPLEPPPGLTRIAKDQDVWIDKTRRTVVVDGVICLREGQLEMFACPKGSKEHESIVAVNAKARFVHAALLAIGTKVGSPVKFAPEYEGATGQVVEIFITWKDAEGKEQKARAQEWVKNVKTKKPMEHDWIFAGSGFWKDESTGDEHYYADNGDMICVSNFATAMLDLPIESSQGNADLLFAADNEKIPPLGTRVRMVLAPKFKDAPAKEPGAKEPGQKAPPKEAPKKDPKKDPGKE